MNNLRVDVVLYDDVGTPYTTKTMHESGMGGSEFQGILLLKELLKQNKKVICVNNTKKVILDEFIKLDSLKFILLATMYSIKVFL
jgi:hypothetical protein